VIVTTSRAAGLLGDTVARDYARKLRLFNHFAEPELRQAIGSLALEPGMRVLDVGCGSGQSLEWLADEVGEQGLVVGIDLAAAHATAARASASPNIAVLQADLMNSPFAAHSFDLIWTVNTINHLRDPSAGLKQLARLLRPGGRIALAQSSLLPDMYFAWDCRLERVTNEAVHRYYRDRYGLGEQDLAAVRSIVGLLRRGQFRDVQVRTFVIERVAPLRKRDEAYLVEAIFRDTWGERLRAYLSAEDFAELSHLCDAADPRFALTRPDFHFLQTLTLAVGTL
jgi:ubiquinone/menaquinone biosynthesis C-methylase UbiE